ncbi:MAG: hypothetical protein HC879_21415, partial [Leptolyngbyaceae cyanobacterium SL_5_9]|nr:hypothetical protein [Leptolyngbyaceae cyanobacterium SL_5_9]
MQLRLRSLPIHQPPLSLIIPLWKKGDRPEPQPAAEPVAEVEVPVELAQVPVEQPAPVAAPANTMTTV